MGLVRERQPDCKPCALQTTLAASNGCMLRERDFIAPLGLSLGQILGNYRIGFTVHCNGQRRLRKNLLQCR